MEIMINTLKVIAFDADDTLWMIETAIRETSYTLPASAIDEIIVIGKEMLSKPVTLLPDVELVLQELSKKYKLVVATKGDLLDQERKLKKSGLMGYFHHIEIMTEKAEPDYQKLIHHLDIEARELTEVRCIACIKHWGLWGTHSVSYYLGS